MFGFGEEDSKQRRLMMMYAAMNQAPQVTQQVAAPDPIANAPASSVVDTSGGTPVFSPDFEGYLNARLGGLGLGHQSAGTLADIYRRTTAANPNMSLADAFASAYNTAASDTRNRNIGVLSQYLPQGYENTAITRSLIDPHISRIFDRQKKEAVDTIDRARSRGQLNTAGYTAATGNLDELGNAARTKLNEFGNSVIGKYRQSVADAIQGAYSAASNAPFGADFSITPYQQTVAERVAAAQSGAGGELENLVGGTNFFNPSDILGKAATNQGFINPGAIKGPGQMFPNQEEEKANKRTMGNIGAF